MSRLTIYSETDSNKPLMVLDNYEAIQSTLAGINIGFERWQANKTLSATADSVEIISLYQNEIDRIMRDFNFGSVDVIHMTPQHPEKIQLREKFLREHVHSEDEVRFFIEGGGLFCLHIENKIYAVKCEKQDFISVPTGVKHWFDAGEHPKFSVIRFFTHKEGWIAHYTGDELATRYPQYVA